MYINLFVITYNSMGMPYKKNLIYGYAYLALFISFCRVQEIFLESINYYQTLGLLLVWMAA